MGRVSADQLEEGDEERGEDPDVSTKPVWHQGAGVLCVVPAEEGDTGRQADMHASSLPGGGLGQVQALADGSGAARDRKIRCRT